MGDAVVIESRRASSLQGFGANAKLFSRWNRHLQTSARQPQQLIAINPRITSFNS
jgi:hypothetical protein